MEKFCTGVKSSCVLCRVTIFWLFMITNWLSYLLYRFLPLFIAIFNMNFWFCERRIDICVVTFWQEKVWEWNYRIYFSVNYRCIHRINVFYYSQHLLFVLAKKQQHKLPKDEYRRITEWLQNPSQWSKCKNKKWWWYKNFR